MNVWRNLSQWEIKQGNCANKNQINKNSQIFNIIN